jgi:hypothetical protein
MIRVVHPGSRIRVLTFSHPGSWIQGSKRHPIPDPGSGSATLTVSTGLFRSSRYEDYRGPPPSSSSRDSRGPPPPRYRSRSPIGRGPSPPRSAFLPPPAPVVFFLLSIFSDKKKILWPSEIVFYSRFHLLSNSKEFKY